MNRAHVSAESRWQLLTIDTCVVQLMRILQRDFRAGIAQMSSTSPQMALLRRWHVTCQSNAMSH
jgi:hypothetical protein